MLPEILKNANSPEGGAKILDNLGVDKGFIDEAYNRYSKYLAKIPGMNATNAKAVIDKVTGAMRGSSGEQRQAPAVHASKPMFDKGKYPKL